MNSNSVTLSETQIRIGAWAGLFHVVTALVAHFAVPRSLEARVGLQADPWFRRETGTVNAGFAYGLVRLLRGHREPTFLRTTAVSGPLMAAVRAVATLRGRRRGPLSAMVIGSDLLLGAGGLVLANQFEREQRASEVAFTPQAAAPVNGQTRSVVAAPKAGAR